MIQVRELWNFHDSEINAALRELQDAGAKIIDIKYAATVDIDEFNNVFNRTSALIVYKVSDSVPQGAEIEKNYPVEDIMGMEIKPGDVYYRIFDDGKEIVLEQNLAAYFAEFYDAKKRVAGE